MTKNTSIDQDIKAAQRLMAILQSRESLERFILLMNPDPEEPDNSEKSSYDLQPFHKYIINHVEKVAKREQGYKRSGLSVPPQHGKSTIVSKYFIAWYLGKNPKHNIIVGTYSEDYAKKLGGEVREIMNTNTYKQIFPKHAFRKGGGAKDDLQIVGGGGVIFRGRGTATTGHPCDLFIIDDPLKDKKEADSSATRRDLHDWYSSVVFSRCKGSTPVFILHTRWHEDDLLGRLADITHPDTKLDQEKIKKIKKRWKYINIPAILDDYELATALGKKVGDALWPERFPLDHLEEARENNPQIFSALYLGKPTPDDGYYFKREWIIEYSPYELPENLTYYSAMDLAVSKDQSRDASVMAIAGVDENKNVWIVDFMYERLESDQLVESIIDKLLEWDPVVSWAEKGAIQKSIGPFLKSRMNDRNCWAYIDEQAATTDKQARARSIQGMIANGKIMFPKNHPHWHIIKDEILKFPNAAHDDSVDALAWLGLGIKRMVGSSSIKKPQIKKHGTAAWLKESIIKNRNKKRIENAVRGW